jgi:hypothetical protein
MTIDTIRRNEVRTTKKESVLPPNSGWLLLNVRRHERKGEPNPSTIVIPSSLKLASAAEKPIVVKLMQFVDCSRN